MRGPTRQESQLADGLALGESGQSKMVAVMLRWRRMEKMCAAEASRRVKTWRRAEWLDAVVFGRDDADGDAVVDRCRGP